MQSSMFTHSSCSSPFEYTTAASSTEDSIDCERDSKRSKSGAPFQSTSSVPWQGVNTQHGLLGWTLGEIYSIPAKPNAPALIPVSQAVKQALSQRLDSESDAATKDLLKTFYGAPMPRLQATHVALAAASTHTPAQSERFRLTPDQAIRIFQMRRTKTAGTASVLALEFGISAKAIRDIWTRKSWAADTKEYMSDWLDNRTLTSSAVGWDHW